MLEEGVAIEEEPEAGVRAGPSLEPASWSESESEDIEPGTRGRRLRPARADFEMELGAGGLGPLPVCSTVVPCALP